MTRSRRSGRVCLALVILIITFSVSNAAAADREFQEIVSRLSAQYQKRPMRFMGLLSFIANRFTPSGVSGMKMAIFEDLDPSRHPAGAGLDSFMQSVVAAAEFQPFVRVRSNRDGEQTFIYARDKGRMVEMLIVSLERDEAVVMRMRLNPKAISKWLDEPIHMGKASAH
jgi:hypothetical protein